MTTEKVSRIVTCVAVFAVIAMMAMVWVWAPTLAPMVAPMVAMVPVGSAKRLLLEIWRWVPSPRMSAPHESHWWQFLKIKAAEAWDSQPCLVFKTGAWYTFRYFKSVAFLCIGMSNPDPLPIYIWPLRILMSLTLTATAIRSGASVLTTIASAIAPLVLAHDVGMLANLENHLLKPLLFFWMITAAFIHGTPQRYHWHVIAVQVAFFFTKGTLACFAVQDPPKFGIILWQLMLIDSIWLLSLTIPVLFSDDLSPQAQKKLALEITKHVSVWAVTWNLPCFAFEIKSFKTS